MLRNKKGMTLKEMVLVILIMAALGLAAIPLFNYLKDLGLKHREGLKAEISFLDFGIS
ncbi:MAG: prepilin-type N-terminal cleavage/methylation domain-containing protein [Deltaproteobacteria bacterium]|nr:prepilin-type N-terminal cleavage/methylation domain-containing protein [Deltaproteobacteria bacterium]